MALTLNSHEGWYYIKERNPTNSYCVTTHGVMDIVIRNGHGDWSSNPGLDCNSHSTYTLGKGINPTILPPAMDKAVG